MSGCSRQYITELSAVQTTIHVECMVALYHKKIAKKIKNDIFIKI